MLYYIHTEQGRSLTLFLPLFQSPNILDLLDTPPTLSAHVAPPPPGGSTPDTKSAGGGGGDLLDLLGDLDMGGGVGAPPPAPPAGNLLDGLMSSGGGGQGSDLLNSNVAVSNGRGTPC